MSKHKDIQFLIDKDIDFNHSDSNINTALHIALLNDDTGKTAIVLIESVWSKKSNKLLINKKNKNNNQSAIQIACHKK